MPERTVVRAPSSPFLLHDEHSRSRKQREFNQGRLRHFTVEFTVNTPHTCKTTGLEVPPMHSQLMLAKVSLTSAMRLTEFAAWSSV